MELQSPVVGVPQRTCNSCLKASALRPSAHLRASVNRQSHYRPDQQVVWQPGLSLPTVVSRTPRRQLRCAVQAAAAENMKVGFVGVGIMGLAMVGMHFYACFLALACVSGYTICVAFEAGPFW